MIQSELDPSKILVLSCFGIDRETYDTDKITYRTILYDCPAYERKLGKLAMHMPNKWIYALFDQWNFDALVCKYSLVIVNEITQWYYPILSYIRRCNPCCKIVYWLWNPIFLEKQRRSRKKRILSFIQRARQDGICIATFDQGDAEKYHFTYLHQMVPYLSMPEEYQDTDIFWVGKDKGRFEYIKNMSTQWEDMGLSCTFWMIGDKHKSYSSLDAKYLLKKAVPYQKVVQQDLKSRAILDITQEGQSGLTWRPIEAMYYQRKLITNFSEIKEYDFYHPDNIFILGEDPIENLRRFIYRPFHRISDTVWQRYTVEGWIDALYKKMGWNQKDIRKIDV